MGLVRLVDRILKDNGCHNHPDCFTCPYDDCIVGDRAAGYHKPLEETARELEQQGLIIREIAQTLGKTAKQVRRYLKKGKEMTGEGKSTGCADKF